MAMNIWVLTEHEPDTDFPVCVMGAYRTAELAAEAIVARKDELERYGEPERSDEELWWETACITLDEAPDTGKLQQLDKSTRHQVAPGAGRRPQISFGEMYRAMELCDICMSSGVELDHVDEHGNSVCVQCAETTAPAQKRVVNVPNTAPGAVAAAERTAEPETAAVETAEVPDEDFWCPKCKDPHHIDITALVDVRMVQSCGEWETDAAEAECRDTEWSGDSVAKCHGCGFVGTVDDFDHGR